MPPKGKRRPAITDPAARGRLLRAIDGFTGQPPAIAALKQLPPVFSRPGELRMAEWSELDLEKAVWSIPASRTKMRREHHVPLSRQASAILKALQPITDGGRLLFPGARSIQRPISENAPNAALWRSYGLPPASSRRWKGKYVGQTQKWFALRFIGEDSEIDILRPGGGAHTPEFDAWRGNSRRCRRASSCRSNAMSTKRWSRTSRISGRWRSEGRVFRQRFNG